MDALYLGIKDLLDGFVPFLGTAPASGGYSINQVLAAFLTYGLVWFVIGRPIFNILKRFGGK